MLKRLPQDNLEDESVGAVASFFNSNGWEFNRQSRDKSGIDGEIEIVHGIERTGRFLKCQIKAGTSYISSESESHVRIRLERKYLDHWAKMNAPVLVFFYHPSTRLIFWKAIKEFLFLYPSLLLHTAESCVIAFDKEHDLLEGESLISLEAVEAGNFRYDSILIEAGRSELGWSNWFPVRSFPTLWQAHTDCARRSLVVPHLSGEYTFTIQDTRLLTFSNMQHEDCELRKFVRVESIRPILQGDVPAQLTTELLNQMLLILAKSKGLIFHGERLYFSSGLLKTPEANIFSYPSLKGRPETRAKIYIQKIGTRVEYKHHAARLSFLQHIGKWYLQVDPGWHFTYPFGKRPSNVEIGARITSEKANTHNKDYLYLLHFWRQFRSPILDREAANKIVDKSLGEFFASRGRYPERLVIHKTSRYTPPEIQGFEDALCNLGIAYDLVSLTKAPLRLIRWGQYPVPRGAMYAFSDNDAYLYTKGFVPDLQTYPGNHVPSPFWVQKAQGDSSIKTICSEILMLTKLNWNTADFCCGVPITLSFARNVGEVFKEFNETDQYEPSRFFRFYM